MSILLNLFKQYWPYIAGLILVIVLVVSFMDLKSDLRDTNATLETTRKELSQSNEKIDALVTNYNQLVDESAARELRLRQYFSALQRLEANYTNTQKLLDDLKQQEGLAAKNPEEYTAKLKKVYEDSEREYSCLTGNLQYCSQ